MHNKDSIYAFFDVDGTLINFNTMIDFLQYFLIGSFGVQESTRRWRKYQNEISQFQDAPREILNQMYYENYAGIRTSVIRKIGVAWFNDRIKGKAYAFNQNTLKELTLHQKNHHSVVFVSGGFFATLEPLAKWLNIKHILCVELLCGGGYLSGEINSATQAIGIGKKLVIESFIENRTGIDLSKCYAYGDHISDYDMLAMVGNPVVVGNDMELIRKIDNCKGKLSKMKNTNYIREQILTIVLESINVINQNLEQPLPVDQGNACPIYGQASGIDSISLVALISIIEELIENKLQQAILMANEKAMSIRNSPFLNVGSLVTYIAKLIEDNSKVEADAK